MRKIALLFSLILLGSATLFAQNQRVSGRVTGPDGSPVAGAMVTVSGTMTASISDADGQYSINAPSGGTLEFSLLGMQRQEVPISGRTTINVQLQADAQAIVAVTVYGTPVSQYGISGSVSSISATELTSTTAVSFDQALSGKMAGVQINTASGLLADGTSIRIRGTNSISNSSQPLVVVDGLPMTETVNLNVFNGGDGTRFNPMATINPNDIQSIEVLKDAASAALYGSRAANGVILITTKRGQAGKVQVSLNSYVAVSQAANRPKMLNADQFIEIQNEAATNWWGAGNDIAAFPASGRVETDWMDLIFKDAFSQNHSLSVSGGTDKLSFYGSADWLGQKGIIHTNELDRYSFRATVDATPTKWFKAGVSVNYSKTSNYGVLSDGYLAGVTIMAYLAMPNAPEKNPDGTYALTANGQLAPGGNLYANGGANTYGNAVYHPTATLNLQRNANHSDRVGAIAYATITPVKGLSITSKVGIDNLNNFEDQYSHPDIAGLGMMFNGLVQDNTVWIKQWNWQNYANYATTIGGNHNISAMVGLEYQQRDYQDIYAGAGDFASADFNEILDGLFTEQMSGGTKNSRGFSSVFANASYNFANRYYFDAYYRRDGYSGFGSNTRYGNFPGFSAAWRIGDERFMESSKNWLSDLKIRTSWGIVGNSNIDPYASRTLYAGGQYAYVNGISTSQTGNAGLTWEQSKKFDVGFDASFLRGRIDVAFDYWRSDMTDMLLNAQVADVTGIPGASVRSNIGAMSNSGIELQINAQTYTSPDGNFAWSSALNLTTVKNRVKKLFTEMSGTNYIIEGKPLGVWWVYEWAGVDPQTGRPGYIDQASGQVKYYDASPDTAAADRWKFADGSAAPAVGAADNKFIDGVSGAPTWYGNFDNVFRYRNLDLTIGLQFAGGNKILNITRAGLLDTRMGNKSAEILDRWQKPGDQTDVARLVWGQNTGLTTSASTRFLESGNYLRMRELTLGYTLPQILADKIGFTGRIYVRANNLFVLTKYTGSDPEISTNRNSNASVGWDNRSVPAVRTYTVGINLNF